MYAYTQINHITKNVSLSRISYGALNVIVK